MPKFLIWQLWFRWPYKLSGLWFLQWIIWHCFPRHPPYQTWIVCWFISFMYRINAAFIVPTITSLAHLLCAELCANALSMGNYGFALVVLSCEGSRGVGFLGLWWPPISCEHAHSLRVLSCVWSLWVTVPSSSFVMALIGRTVVVFSW